MRGVRDVRTLAARNGAVLAVAVLGLVACSTSKIVSRTPTSDPIPIGEEGTIPIAFKRIIVRIPSGVVVGAHHDGLAQMEVYTHTWQGHVFIASDELNLVATEELRGIGYNVLGFENLVFDEDHSSKARYWLGGTLDALQYNSFAPLAGNYSEAQVEVEWQLYDAPIRKVVYTTRTSGYGRLDGMEANVVAVAFAAALRNLTATAPFVDFVRARRTQAPAYAPSERIQLRGPAPQSRKLPRDLDRVLQSVVLLRVGAVSGSGFLVSDDGYLVTAAHVVEGASEALVRLRTGIELPGQVVRVDSESDVALVKLPGSGYTPLRLDPSRSARVGSEVYAVGAPFGGDLSFSVTKGIVSAVREVEGRRVIQTDAAVNAGSSGGPLIDLSANGIAVISWKLAGAGAEGLGFGLAVGTAAERLGIEFLPTEP